MAKILLVEDDKAISRVVKEALEAEHHLVDSCFDGRSALDYIKSFEYDLIILDIQLPDLSGVDLCKSYRRKSTGPVLMLTGMNRIEDKVEGLESGADDYLTKPFDMRELVARVKSQLRRSEGAKDKVLKAGRISLDTESRIVSRDGNELALTPREFDVLEFFLRHPNQVIGPDALLKRVWHSDSEASPHAVYNCLNRLRKNIDPKDKESLIKTIHGVGYRLELP